MFINLTNHPSSKWDQAQIDAVPKKYGEIVDLPFPNIAPALDTEGVAALAMQYFDKIAAMVEKGGSAGNAVHLMGETVFVYTLASLLLQAGFPVLASTTERIVSFEGENKISTFRFVRFRRFPDVVG
jgi:hypothetical protein